MELDPAVVLVPFLGVASLLPVLSFVALQGSEMASIFQEPALCAEAPWQLRPCWIRIVRKRSFSEPFTCQDTSPDAISNLAEAGRSISPAQLTCSMSCWVGVGPAVIGHGPRSGKLREAACEYSGGGLEATRTYTGTKDPREPRPAIRYELRLDRCARLIRSLRSRPTRTGNRSPDQLTREWLWAVARSFC